MGKDLKVLYVLDSDNGFNELLQGTKKAKYNVIPVKITPEEVIGVLKKNEFYDLIILYYPAIKNQLNKIVNINGIHRPVICIVDNEELYDYMESLNYQLLECIYHEDIPLLGCIIKHLLGKTQLYNQLQNAKSELENEKEYLTATLASIGDGVITLDLKGCVIFMNQTAEELTGWSENEAKGNYLDTIFRLINKESNEVMESPFIRTMKRGFKSGLTRSTVLISKDLTEYYISASSSPIRDKNGKILGLVIVFRDITRIKEIENDLQNEQKNLKAIFDAAPVGMLIVDENMVVKQMNETFLKTFGIRSSLDILEQKIGSAIGCTGSFQSDEGCGKSQECFNCQLNEIIKWVTALYKPVKDLEIKKQLVINNQSMEFWLRINSVPILLDGTKHAIVVIEDITQYRKLEENLIKSRDFYLTLFEHFPAMIWRSDANKKFNYFNKGWLNFTGRTIEQELGDGWIEGLHPEDVELCIKTYLEAFDSREAFEMEYRLRNKDGHYGWIVDIGRPFYDIDNKFSGYIGACFDNTERKIAEEGLRRYQLLSHNANDIILFADISGNVIEANDAAIRTFGYQKEELSGKSLYSLVGPDPGSQEGLQPDENKYYDTVAFRKDGSVFTAEVSMQDTEIGKSKVLMAIIRDVTDKKRINEELKQAKESAEAANHAKSEFLANMSHEIRTPLNGMLGMIDLTLLAGLPEEQKENMYIAKECANTLLNLINDILDFSKIEAGKLIFESINFDIRDLIGQTIKPHLIKAKEKGLTLQYAIDCNIPQIVSGDSYRIRQVINNLVGNAVKFTVSGSVNLYARILDQNNDSVELEFQISDTGIGIAAEDMALLFNSFSQVDSSYTRKYGGPGLGLAISKQLVEKMGGTIWVTSVEGTGSTFYFSVKLRTGHKEDNISKVITHIEKTNHPKQILLVEDDQTNMMVISRLIKETGNIIETAVNGIEALNILTNRDFDLVLMDIQMPEMDGIETTFRIREKELSTGKHIPIVALTAHALKGDKEKFLSVGMDGYLPKPFQIDDFLNTIDTVTDKAKRTDINTNLKSRDFMESPLKSIGAMIENINEKIRLLNCSLDDSDMDGVEKYAHEIKVIASDINANNAKNLIFKVEMAARKGNVENVAECVAMFAEEFNKYEKSIKSEKNN
ncbi:MAG: PAS domain S-box protein [Bacillota bacterium]|nr:PAS domain S-box protein [Bacillota bacterium]